MNKKQKKKIEIFKFNPVIYPFKIWIIVTKNIELINEYFYDDIGNNIELENCIYSKAFTGRALDRNTNEIGAFIVFNSIKDITFENVTHEASHAGKLLFEHINSDITPHEPFEYLIGWIAKCCSKVKEKLIEPWIVE